MKQEERAKMAWEEYQGIHKTSLGNYYTGQKVNLNPVEDFKSALIKQVLDINQKEDYFKYWTTGDIIKLINEVEPPQQ